MLEHTGGRSEDSPRIRRAAQQLAEAAEAAARAADDTAVERWVRRVVVQVAEVAAALDVSILLTTQASAPVEEYARRIDQAINAGGIFGSVQISGERMARVLDEVAGGTASETHAARADVLRALWAIVETLEVYGWSHYFVTGRPK
jgi:hypothetical protein